MFATFSYFIIMMMNIIIFQNKNVTLKIINQNTEYTDVDKTHLVGVWRCAIILWLPGR